MRDVDGLEEMVVGGVRRKRGSVGRTMILGIGSSVCVSTSFAGEVAPTFCLVMADSEGR